MTEPTRNGLRKLLATGLLVAFALSACASEPRFREITIVHTNDLHGHVESAAAIAAVAKMERDRNSATLFLDAGDCITGTPLSTVFQGRPVFEIMTLMGYDAVALGNHEFDHGFGLIADYRRLAGFPILCANARDPEGAPLGDAPHRIFDLGGVRVGVLGLVTADVPALTTTKASAGCTFDDPVETAALLVPELRKQCDVVVLLTHVGVEVDAALAGSVKGVDVVIGGHSHTELRQPLLVEGVPVVQAKCYGERVGILALTWDTEERRVTESRGRLVTVEPATMPGDAATKRLVDTWEAKVEDRVKEVIGRTDRDLGRNELRRLIERVYREVLGADLAYQNTGGIRSVIATGDISVRDVWTVLPFDNTLVRIRVRGDRLPEAMRKELGDRWSADREYVIATISYVADHRDRFLDCGDAPVEDTGLLMRDVVVDWVREHGGF